MKAKLTEMKTAITQDRSWNRQRGPNDTAGHAEDSKIRRRVFACKTWGELEYAAPQSWVDRVVNRTLEL